MFFTTQNLLIFPGAATQGHPAAEFHPDPDTPLVRLTTARGDRVVALFGPALTPDGRPHPNAARRPTILYFYGNGMCLKGTTYEFGHFRRLGANVLIPEYVGYGLSGGQAGEVGCRETADAAYDHLSKRPDVDPAKIVAAGRSLGGAVAIDLALRRPVATLFTLSTFTRLADLARHHYPFLPAAEWLLQDWFDSLAKIGRVDCPVLFVHGRRDEIVPFAMMDRLAAAARRPSRDSPSRAPGTSTSSPSRTRSSNRSGGSWSPSLPAIEPPRLNSPCEVNNRLSSWMPFKVVPLRAQDDRAAFLRAQRLDRVAEDPQDDEGYCPDCCDFTRFKEGIE